jgi:hypothetical protein
VGAGAVVADGRGIQHGPLGGTLGVRGHRMLLVQ